MGAGGHGLNGNVVDVDVVGGIFASSGNVIQNGDVFASAGVASEEGVELGPVSSVVGINGSHGNKGAEVAGVAHNADFDLAGVGGAAATSPEFQLKSLKVARTEAGRAMSRQWKWHRNTCSWCRCEVWFPRDRDRRWYRWFHDTSRS